MNTSCGRMPGFFSSFSTMRANSACFCATLRVLLTVSWMITRSSVRSMPR
jgi:hypothetical protein